MLDAFGPPRLSTGVEAVRSRADSRLVPAGGARGNEEGRMKNAEGGKGPAGLGEVDAAMADKLDEVITRLQGG